MAYSHYDRLSALDATFLEIEDGNAHMHVGSISTFDAGPLTTPDGGLDFERICAFAEPALRRRPRFRQRLAYVPLLGHPVWVDDEHFNLHYHLRHTALPEPGDERQLKRLAGRILSQQLDRGKPLWEMWFVEGLEGGRFAILTKAHHAMIDGISGADLMASLVRGEPDAEVAARSPWLPRPRPSGARLLVDETLRRVALPATLLQAAAHAAAAPMRALRGAVEEAEGLREALGAGLSSASPSSLNRPLGPHRRFDWLRFELEAVKQVGRRLGGTLNDVVLTVVTGALRELLRRRGDPVDQLHDFRAFVPVSLRTADERGTLGNRVAMLLAKMPIDEADPLARLRRVSETMGALKRSKQARGTELLEEISDRVVTTLFAQLARLGARERAYNVVVTNVPGPQFPVYFLGSKMEAVYPVVPLFQQQTLGIALFSYDGALFWGLNADWDAMPDLHDLLGLLQDEFDVLRKAEPPQPRAPRARRAARRGRT